MKLRFAGFVFAVICLLFPSGTYAQHLYFQDYEDMTAGAFSNGTDSTSYATSSVLSANIMQESNKNKYLSFSKTGAGTMWVNKNISSYIYSDKPYSVSVKVKSDHTESSFILTCGNSIEFLYSSELEEYILRVYDTDSSAYVEVENISVSLSDWTEVCFDIDPVKDIVDIYVDKQSAAVGLHIRQNKDINVLRVDINNGYRGTYCMDNLRVSDDTLSGIVNYENDFSALSPLRAEKENTAGLHGKPLGDNSLRLKSSIIDASNDFFTGHSVSNYYGDDISLSFEIYPNNTVNCIYFATAYHKAVSKTVPMVSLVQNKWNVVNWVYSASDKKSRLYINGELHSENTVALSGGTLRVVFKVNYAEYSKDNCYAEIDNYRLVSGTLPAKAAEFAEYTADGAYINGYLKDTPAEFIKKITLPEKTDITEVKNSSSEISADYDIIEKGSSAYIYRDNILTGQYYFDTADYETESTVVYNNGYVSGDNKYGKGILKFTTLVKSYTKNIPVMSAAALYDKDGRMIKLNISNETVAGEKVISAQLSIDEKKGEVRYMLINPDNMKPYCNKVVINPYSDAEIERVTPLYRGYTSKAAVFSYDDCREEDVKLIELLEKYNAKGTFNIMWKRVGTAMRELCLSETGKDDDASVYEFVKNIYEGHEIANHTVNHYPAHLDEGETGTDSSGGKLTGVSTEEEIADVTVCSENIKKYLGRSEVIGLAWPNGYGTARDDYQEIEAAIKQAGIRYARAAETGSFVLPSDWMRWGSTCHHNDAMGYVPAFAEMENSGALKCLFIWGHAYELENASSDDSNWTMMENVLKKLNETNDIWYASNGEVYKYAEAVKLLVQNENTLTNNSDEQLYVQVNGSNIIIAPHESYSL